MTRYQLMNIQTVKKEEMEALKSLAETNLKVSEVKGTLATMKVEEGAYIKKREEKTLKAIEKLVKESSVVLGDAYQSYNDVHNLSKSSSEFALFLSEAHQDFLALKDTFEESTEAWKDHVEALEAGLEEVKKQIKLDKEEVKRDQDEIRKMTKVMNTEKKKLIDERETLKRAIIRLKEKRV